MNQCICSTQYIHSMHLLSIFLFSITYQHLLTFSFFIVLSCTSVHTLCDLDLNERGLIYSQVSQAPISNIRGYHAITGCIFKLSLLAAFILHIQNILPSPTLLLFLPVYFLHPHLFWCCLPPHLFWCCLYPLLCLPYLYLLSNLFTWQPFQVCLVF